MRISRLLAFRQPKVSVYLALSLSAALLGAFGLELMVRDLLKDLSTLPADSPDAVVLRSAASLTGLTIFLGLFTLLMSGALFQAFRRAVDERRLPPSGSWSVAAARPLSGDAAVWMARAGMGLCGVLAACGVALGATAFWMVSRVLACAARNL